MGWSSNLHGEHYKYRKRDIYLVGRKAYIIQKDEAMIQRQNIQDNQANVYTEIKKTCTIRAWNYITGCTNSLKTFCIQNYSILT